MFQNNHYGYLDLEPVGEPVQVPQTGAVVTSIIVVASWMLLSNGFVL